MMRFSLYYLLHSMLGSERNSFGLVLQTSEFYRSAAKMVTASHPLLWGRA